MVKHIVMWKVRGNTRDERLRNQQTIKTSLESLRGKVPGLVRLEVGLDCSRIDYAFDVVLVSEFESTETLAAYANHPEHLRVKQEMGDLRIARYQVDYLSDPT